MITFYKYQGTGNDFIMIDNRLKSFPKYDLNNVKKLCDRKFGIGADGLILIENHNDCDFEMVYFNSDGSQSFCGNGSRCAVAFAKHLGIIQNETKFLAIDGMHEATIKLGGEVRLKMNPVNEIEKGNDYFFINTGSPHYIKYVNNVSEIDITKEAQAIRYSERFKAEGTNVNFAEVQENQLKVRTYERGVEDETLSCGTGVTAVALSAAHQNLYNNECPIEVMGGNLKIEFNKKSKNSYDDIWLVGPAKFVYKGEI